MSGDQPRIVELFSPVTASLVQALPKIERRLERRITVVGGLAVLSRLGSAAHRVTSDVDTVNRRLGGEPGQLDVLLATGATAIDGAGAMVTTPDRRCSGGRTRSQRGTAQRSSRESD